MPRESSFFVGKLVRVDQRKDDPLEDNLTFLMSIHSCTLKLIYTNKTLKLNQWHKRLVQ